MPARLILLVTLGLVVDVVGAAPADPSPSVKLVMARCKATDPRGCQQAYREVRKLCDGGDGDACATAGVMLREGLGVGADAKRAVLSLDKGCKLKAANACVTLAAAYTMGEGAPKSAQLAAGYFTQACDLGDLDSCTRAAQLYAGESDPSVPKDLPKARTLYQKACERKDAGACSGLGAMIYQGLGGPVDRPRGVALLQMACKLGDPLACSAASELSKRR